MEAAHLPDELFDLLAEKPYAALSESERLLVAPHLSAIEYDDLHTLIGEVKTADQQILTSPAPKQLPKRRWLHRVLYHPIPLYQAAAAVAIILGGYWLWAQALPSEVDPGLPYVRTGTSIELDSYPDSLVFQL